MDDKRGITDCIRRGLIRFRGEAEKNLFGCENFSFFYGEKNPERRCLLGEYVDSSQMTIFREEEIKTLCPHYNPEKKGKCGYVRKKERGFHVPYRARLLVHLQKESMKAREERPLDNKSIEALDKLVESEEISPAIRDIIMLNTQMRVNPFAGG